MSNKKSATSSKDSRFSSLPVRLLIIAVIWGDLLLSCREASPKNGPKAIESESQSADTAKGTHSKAAEKTGDLEGKIPKNFVKLYVELRLATTGNPNHPQRARESRKIIMEKYKMTWKDYRHHVETLRQHPEVWEAFQQTVLSELDLLEKRHKGE